MDAMLGWAEKCIELMLMQTTTVTWKTTMMVIITIMMNETNKH